MSRQQALGIQGRPGGCVGDLTSVSGASAVLGHAAKHQVGVLPGTPECLPTLPAPDCLPGPTQSHPSPVRLPAPLNTLTPCPSRCSTSRRRAAPPRPSLLVGDLSECRAAFDALQEEVLRLQLGESASLAGAGRGGECSSGGNEQLARSSPPACCLLAAVRRARWRYNSGTCTAPHPTLLCPAADAAAWERLVPRCRAIRETLTSEHELSDFTRQVRPAGRPRPGCLNRCGRACACLHLWDLLACRADNMGD